MNRRTFLQGALSGLFLGRLDPPVVEGRKPPSRPREDGASIQGSQIVPRRVVEMPATLQARAFAASSGDDGRYHALVHEAGGAAGKSLLTTPMSDQEVARRLRESGADDGGGVPMAAWNRRHLPFFRAPRTRVAGTPLRILVDWDGWDAPREISSLLEDPGGRGVMFRFGGNEEHDHIWESGCIACLFSCPGGVVSNERYTIRDQIRGVTRFSPALGLPEADTAVTVSIELLG